MRRWPAPARLSPGAGQTTFWATLRSDPQDHFSEDVLSFMTPMLEQVHG